jgi:hypothetical protein
MMEKETPYFRCECGSKFFGIINVQCPEEVGVMLSVLMICVFCPKKYIRPMDSYYWKDVVADAESTKARIILDKEVEYHKEERRKLWS